MTIINNYDQSSTGVNIEFSGCWDTDLSRIYFNESFKRVCDGVFTYGGANGVKPCMDIKIKALKKDLLKFVSEHITEDCESWSKSDLLDSAMDYLEQELVEYNYNIEELASYCQFEVSFKNEIEIFITRGYSQGDYAKVIVDHTECKKAFGNNAYKKTLQQYIDHLFWDSPVFARLEIDNKEYEYFEYCDDSYSWDREKFINGVSRDSGVSVKVLENIVPSELDYQ